MKIGIVRVLDQQKDTYLQGGQLFIFQQSSVVPTLLKIEKLATFFCPSSSGFKKHDFFFWGNVNFHQD
jgi:hypothetical protein